MPADRNTVPPVVTSRLSDLAEERDLFERRYPDFLSEHLGQVVLIYGNDVLGFFASMPKAEEEAYRRFNLLGKPFLLRRILTPEQEAREEIYQRLDLTSSNRHRSG